MTLKLRKHNCYLNRRGDIVYLSRQDGDRFYECESGTRCVDEQGRLRDLIDLKRVLGK